MKGIFKYCLFLFLLFSVLFTLPVEAAEGAKVLKIGTINPLSGAAALWGRIVTEQSLKPLIEMINHKGGLSVGGDKYKLELISEDDKATAAGGRAAAEKLIFNDKVKFMVGNLLPASIMAMAPLATEQKIITIIGSGSVLVKPEFPYLFQTTPSYAQRIYSIATVIKKKYPDLKTVAMLNPDDESGLQMQKAAPRILPQFNMETVFDERHPRGTKDYYPFLTKLVTKKPDILLTASGPGDFALMGKQIRELGFKGRLTYISTVADFDSFIKMAGESASEGILAWYDDFNAPSANARMKEFQEFYTKILKGSPADIHLAAYMASLEILVQALEKANSFDPEKVLQVLHTAEFDTFIGKSRFEGKETFGIAHRLNGIVRIGEIKGRGYIYAGEALFPEP